MRRRANVDVRFLGVACLLGAVGAAMGACSGDDTPLGSSAEQLQGADASTCNDATLSDVTDDEVEAGGCRHVELDAVKSGGKHDWSDSETLSPPMQFLIPTQALATQNNAGQHSVTFTFKMPDGGEQSCDYSGGGKAAQNHPDYPYALTSCTGGAKAGDAVESDFVSLVLNSGGTSEAKIDLDEIACGHNDAGPDAIADAPTDVRTDANDAAGDVVTDAPLDAPADVSVEAEAGPSCDPQSCDDHNACNGVETCQNNVCTPGTAPVVDDGNPCTIDACDPQSGVTHTPSSSGTSCGSTNQCTGTQTCNGAGTCVQNPPVVVDDGNPCTVDTCDPQLGAVHTPASSGTSCGSTNVCTGTQTCNGTGACVQNPPAVVDDGNPCTTDSCDPQNGVTHTPASSGTSCGSTNLCTGTQTCNSTGACIQNAPVVVDDGNPCTIDTCDPQLGAIHTASPQGTICGSSNVCTGVLACDGAGTCVQGPPSVVDDGNPCTTDTCDPQTGVTHTPIAPGTACADNSNLCIGAYTCDATAVCAQGPAPTVDDGNPCTTDACDPQTGVSHTPVAPGTACADNSNLCVGAYTCNANATCTQAPAPVLDDGNICTTDTCNPQTGVVHTPIPKCDPSPTTGSGVFETQASLLGKIVDTGGNPVSGVSFEVHDAPSGAPRTDVSATSAGDGSFRIRLTQFPTTENGPTPAHHEVVYFDAPNFIRAYRDAFLRPGDAVDFGNIVVVTRDPKVTLIGPNGGTATDSQGLMTLVVPAGALNTSIPIQMTPFMTRDQVPSPLPQATLTTYAFELEPSGTTFSVPATLIIKNWRNVPSNLAMPVGFYDPIAGHWNHETQATYSSQGWSFSVGHFSVGDLNGVQLGDWLVKLLRSHNPNDSQMGCGLGSSVGLTNGSLRQAFGLPTYNVRSVPFGVTLHYDSGLAGSRHYNDGAASSANDGVVAHSGVQVPVAWTQLQAQCVPRAAAAFGATSDSCNAGSCSLASVAAPINWMSSLAGQAAKTSGTLKGQQSTVETGGFVDLPDDQNGDPIGSGFLHRNITVTFGVTTACGSTAPNTPFGTNLGGASGTNVNLQPGPMTLEEHVFVHHRHNSPYGAGWAVRDIDRLFTDGPNHAVLVNGDGSEEEFRPYTDLTLGAPFNNTFTYFAFARDKGTGDNFALTALGNLVKVNADLTTSPVLSGINLGGRPHGLAVGYVNSARVFVAALDQGLVAIDGQGATTTLVSGTVPSELVGQQILFDQGHVAARGDLAYYTDGVTPLLYRIHLATNAVDTLSMSSGGDQRLDPKATLSGVQFTAPAGLAFASDGSLYLAERAVNVVFKISPDSQGQIGPTSTVRRVVGDGYGGVLPPVGDRYAGQAFGINTPVYLSTWDDDTLLIGTLYGVAAYSPLSDDATWILFTKNAAESDFTINFNAQSQDIGDLLALGPKVVLGGYVRQQLVRADASTLGSVYNPSRRLMLVNGQYFLDDKLADLSEAFDGAGRLVQRNRSTGEAILSVQYVDSKSDAVANVIDAQGGVTSFSYNGSGKLTGITDPMNRTNSVSVDGFGDMTSFSEPNGEQFVFTYGGHQMTQKTSPAGDVTKYDYSGDGTLLKSTKPTGEFTTFAPPLAQAPTADANGNPTRSGSYTNMYGVTHNIVVNRAGDVERDTFTADNVTYTRQPVYDQFLWAAPNTSDPRTRMNRIFRVANHTLNGMQEDLVSRFDTLGRLILVHDTYSSLNTRVGLSYDANGYLASYQGPGAYDIHTIVRDNSGHITHVYVPNGGGILGPETFYTYNRTDGQPDTVTVHGVTYNLGYDSNGNLKSSVDTGGLGITTTLTRDAYGNVATVNDGQASWAFSYDANNRLVSATDASFNTTTYSYTIQSCNCSEADRLTSIHTPDLPSNLKWALDYWPEGRLKTITDPDDHVTSLTYQPTGELTQVVDANNHGASMGYDSLGRLSSAFDALGRAHARIYPVPNSSGWSGPSIMSGGPNGTPVTTDFTQPLATGQYQIGLNLFQTKGDPAQVSFYRDATFELSYGMTWDQARRLTRRRDRAGTAISSATVIPSGNGQYDETKVGYNLSSSDAVVSLIESDYPATIYEDATFTQNADYDDTQVNGWGQRLPGAFENLTRDTAGRITKHTRQFSAGNGGAGAYAVPFTGFSFVGPQTTYTYSSSNGRVTNFTDADGSHDVIYDTRGLVSKITIQGEGDYLFGYDGVGRNTSVTYPGGFGRTQQYDHQGRLVSRCYTHSGFADRCYTGSFDGAGNPLTMTDPEGSYTFGYDALDRLVQSTRVVTNQSDEVENYDYNALGALHTNAGLALDDQRPKLAGGGTADAAVPNTYGNQPVTLDAGGRITSLFGNTLAYNPRGRLIAVTHPTVNNTTNAEYYGYDAQMRRIGRFGVVNGTASATDYEYFIWDGANLVASVDKTNTKNKSWFYEGVDQPLRLTAGTLKYYYELDLAGNVRRLRRPDGTDAGGYRYSAFGQQLPADLQTPVAQVDQPLRWKARQWSGFGQLYDVRARWWSPQLGVFTSIDEVQFHDERSTLWGWPGANSLRYSDPSGNILSPVRDQNPWVPDAQNTLFGASGYFRGLASGDWASGSYFSAVFNEAVSEATRLVGDTLYVLPRGPIRGEQLLGMMGVTAAPAACFEEGAFSKTLNYSPQDLQKGFMKHGGDFGLTGNWNPGRSAEFSAAVNQHINDPTVVEMGGTYRGDAVTHYYNPATGVNVMADSSNIYVGGWTLSEQQTANLLRSGNVQ